MKISIVRQDIFHQSLSYLIVRNPESEDSVGIIISLDSEIPGLVE